MTKNTRIEAFAKLGEWMLDLDETSKSIVENAQYKNPWYTPSHIHSQFVALGSNLTSDTLNQWLAEYTAPETNKTVGLILAGNLPLVGFHDILCTLIMGFTAQIKVSSDDAGLTTLVLNKLKEIQPAFNEKIQLVEKLTHFDLIIATGSNNSSRYFEYYFGKKPHIIRKNRNSIAVISGNETTDELKALGNDIFDYFGLGCRSVSKVFIPKDYNMATFFEAMESFSTIKDHFKYNNNYDYNKSIYLINKDKHFDNGFLLLKEDKAISSPLAVVFYEEYETTKEVETTLNAEHENIQCVVSSLDLQISSPLFSFGQSQCPALDDYADNVNTLKFLSENH